MIQKSQQEDESFYVTRFLEAQRIFEPATPQPQGSGPDFVLEGRSPQIGIEVTELYRKEKAGLGRKQMEGIRDEVLNSCKALWSSAAFPHVEVHVHFIEHRTPFPKDIPGLAKEIVQVVANNIPDIGGVSRVNRDWDRPDDFPKEVHSISIVRLASYDRSYWSAPDAAFAGQLTDGLVQRCISRKAAKYATYAARCSINWLLIVLDSFRLSGVFNLDDTQLTTHVFESPFARTLLFDTLTKKVIELTTSPPS
jgi:hypothetical protein